jgi:hypothetical protein
MKHKIAWVLKYDLQVTLDVRTYLCAPFYDKSRSDTLSPGILLASLIAYLDL